MSNLKAKDVVTLEVKDLAFGGRGVADLDGRVIFVDGGLPGDVAEVRISKVKRRYCEGVLEKILQPSPARIKPPCEHFGICGGCKWLNYEYDRQLAYKTQQLRNQLIHIGGIDNPPIEPAVGAKKLFHYRNKMEFSFGGNPAGSLVLGLHERASYTRIFDLHRCFLQSEVSNRVVELVREEAKRLGLPVYDCYRDQGLLRFLVVRDGKFTRELMVNLVTSAHYQGYEDKVLALGQRLAKELPSLTSLLWTVNSRKANIARWDAFPPSVKDGVLFGRPHIFEKLGDWKFRLSADSFFQTNSYQAQLLYDVVIEYGQFAADDIVIDLYSGIGTIAIYISGLVKEVMAVESVQRSVEDAVWNARENGVHNVKFMQGQVEDLIGDLKRCEKVIVDPPRAGLHPKALKGIGKMAPHMIIYISCNASTLARDIAALAPFGYRLTRAVPVDMFPHTYHIEAVAQLIKE